MSTFFGLDSRLLADRERAVPIVTEYLGPLETAAENLSAVRDIDEQFWRFEQQPSKPLQ